MAKNLEYLKISTGDILREAIMKNDNLGKKVKQYLTRGELVPDEIVVDIVQQEISRGNKAKNIVLDGFPRNINQAKGLEKSLSASNRKVSQVLYFCASLPTLIDRLTNRRICPKCGIVYNLRTNPPEVNLSCDRCGTQLVKRSDDDKDVVEARLKVFEKETAHLVDFYRKEGLLSSIDALESPEKVWERVKAALKYSDTRTPKIKRGCEE